MAFPPKSNSQSVTNLKDINKVWHAFYQAFDSLDYKPMAAIHSKKLIRISGGKNIINYDTYINNYKLRFSKAKKNKHTSKISLQFSERINNDSIASQRGIYKLIRNKDTQQTYYGQFHVILKKEQGFWKIVMDYDANENNSITEKQYLQAHAITDYHKFKKE